jgi:hypothetical protein
MGSAAGIVGAPGSREQRVLVAPFAPAGGRTAARRLERPSDPVGGEGIPIGEVPYELALLPEGRHSTLMATGPRIRSLRRFGRLRRPSQ